MEIPLRQLKNSSQPNICNLMMRFKKHPFAIQITSNILFFISY